MRLALPGDEGMNWLNICAAEAAKWFMAQTHSPRVVMVENFRDHNHRRAHRVGEGRRRVSRSPTHP